MKTDLNEEPEVARVDGSASCEVDEVVCLLTTMSVLLVSARLVSGAEGESTAMETAIVADEVRLEVTCASLDLGRGLSGATSTGGGGRGRSGLGRSRRRAVPRGRREGETSALDRVFGLSASGDDGASVGRSLVFVVRLAIGILVGVQFILGIDLGGGRGALCPGASLGGNWSRLALRSRR